MQKRNYLLGIVVLLSSFLYGISGNAIGTDAVMTNEMKITEPSQEAIDACAGKTENSSCEYTLTGTRVAGVCQKNANVDDDTSLLICQ